MRDTTRSFLIIAKCGRFYAWDYGSGNTPEEAGKEFIGILECGGDIWETEDGNLPESLINEFYEIIAEVDVTNLSHESIVTMAEFLKKMSDLSVVEQVMVA